MTLLDLLISPAYAQVAGQAAPGGFFGGGIAGMLPMLLIFGAVYFLMIRPQQRRLKEHQAMVAGIRRGDTVVTSGGLVGKVTKVVDDDQIEFEISDGVRVRQMRQMISGVRAKGEPAKEKPETAKEDTSAS